MWEIAESSLIYLNKFHESLNHISRPWQDNSMNEITFKQKSNNHKINESEEIGDTLVEVLTSINCRTLNTENIIGPWNTI